VYVDDFQKGEEKKKKSGSGVKKREEPLLLSEGGKIVPSIKATIGKEEAPPLQEGVPIPELSAGEERGHRRLSGNRAYSLLREFEGAAPIARGKRNPTIIQEKGGESGTFGKEEGLTTDYLPSRGGM